MDAKLAELKRRLAEVDDLRSAAAVLDWDQMVLMPPAGAAVRAERLATLQRVAHERFVDGRIGELLEELRPLEQSLPHDADDACLVRVTRTDWEKARRVPADLAAEMAKASSEGMEAWAAARAAGDYAAFRPWLDRHLALKHAYVECFEPAADPYDILLDDFEPGTTTAEVRAVFDRLKEELVPLIAALRDSAVDPLPPGPYPVEAQRALGLEAMTALGFEPSSFRLDSSVHPFCTSFAISDIRVTARYDEGDLESLFTCLHEIGHGLYERGISPELERTPLASGCSSGLHESQSRLWENVVGRSLPFWRWFHPRLQAAFPGVLGDMPLEACYRAVNRVSPSFIRVDADEVTYGMHIILRFELEQELLAGTLSSADLPEAWNARFEEYLGLAVPEDRLGVLQDVHWSGGAFGYFPTYQLGNVMSVQIWEAARAALPGLEEQFEQGDFSALGAWLRENLYALGRKLTPKETLERVVGGPLDPEPYLRYLREKYGAGASR
ncbi:Zn-dependent carboxypeptidase [Gaiella occulta]|uniref:Metal-dependent carboxypeptidase n=1 Tax=Gaiella occulta TaxID=1002870 RepID=A0A7M2YTN4_9ACTN|nr:carboxypeptidase M32 [Gaiella occulta]RDI73446.1 Zn-dependent carboxypeptidase [Gaiella occulta]